LLGYDCELDPTFLKVENRIRYASLLEDVLIFLIFQDRFASPYLREKGLGIELFFGSLSHRSLP
jgi:hypothetical protein